MILLIILFNLIIIIFFFFVQGRAEPIRRALFAGGIAFEDVRLTGAEFGE
jgi:hypothetical protein